MSETKLILRLTKEVTKLASEVNDLNSTISDLESDFETCADHNIQLQLSLNAAVSLLLKASCNQIPAELNKEIREFIDDFEVEE